MWRIENHLIYLKKDGKLNLLTSKYKEAIIAFGTALESKGALKDKLKDMASFRAGTIIVPARCSSVAEIVGTKGSTTSNIPQDENRLESRKCINFGNSAVVYLGAIVV